MSLRLTNIAAAVALSLACTLPAVAGGDLRAPAPVRSSMNWYISGFGGISHVESFDDHGFDLSGSYKLGYDFGGAVGLRLGHIRIEEQYTYARNNIKTLRDVLDGEDLAAPGFTYDGQGKLHALMTNVIYDFHLPSDTIGLYAGAGVGVARVLFDIDTREDLGAGLIDFTTYTFRQSKFAYQGLVGINFNTDNQFVVGLGYRYLATGKLDGGAKVHDHMVNLDLTYHFPVA